MITHLSALVKRHVVLYLKLYHWKQPLFGKDKQTSFNATYKIAQVFRKLTSMYCIIWLKNLNMEICPFRTHNIAILSYFENEML